MIVSVSGLTKRYGAVSALDEVSFDVKPGECFALLGPNGSGKTTALKCLAGLVRPSGGRIAISGSAFSYLPQEASFPEHLTLGEVLRFYAALRGLPAPRVDAVARLFDCAAYADRQVAELSGGMRQRLAIAVACLPDAPVLLLDEPTASLDPQGAVDFRRLLTEFKREGKTVLFTSHVLADVDALADRAAILVGGRLLAVEAIEALRSGLQAQCRVRAVLESAPQPFVALARQAGAEQADVEEGALVLTSPPERRMPILLALDRAGARILRFSTEEPSLEEIYLRYMHAETRHHGDAGRAASMPVSSATAG